MDRTISTLHTVMLNASVGPKGDHTCSNHLCIDLENGAQGPKKMSVFNTLSVVRTTDAWDGNVLAGGV